MLRLRIDGNVDASRLRLALAATLRRHPNLAIGVRADARGPIVVPGESPEVPFDEREIDSDAEPVAIENAVREFVDAPLPLDEPPLWRARLFRVASDDHRLVVVTHPVVLDVASLRSLPREIWTHYADPQASDTRALPPDHSVAQPHANVSASFESDDAVPLDLSFDHRDPPHSCAFASWDSRVERSTLAALAALADESGESLRTVVAATLAALLTRHSGQDTLTVGLPDSVSGPTLGAHVLHTRLCFDFANSANLWGALHARQSLEGGGAPLEVREVEYRAIEPIADPLPPTVRVEVTDDPHTLIAWELDSTAHTLTWIYSSARFSEERIRELDRQWGEICTAWSEDPERSIDDRLTTPSRVDRSANSPETTLGHVPYESWESGPDTSLIDRFDEMCRRYPKRIAVTAREVRVTYGELQAQSTRIARGLSNLPPESRIALLLSPGVDTVASILGVLRAGHAYVPLDPMQPPARLAKIVSAVEPAGWIVECAHRGRASETAPELPQWDPTTLDDPGASLPSELSGESLAYVLFTSGSTGEPKGVRQSQRNVAHHIASWTNGLHLHADDRLAMVSSYAYDSGAQDIFGALLNGATVALFDLATRSVPELRRWLDEEAITVFHATPTVFRTVSAAGQEPLRSVRLVVLGGEATRPSDLELFRENFPSNAVFVNGLGMTESTTALQWHYSATSSFDGSTIPIGFPVSGLDVELLHPDGSPASIRGEIALRTPRLFCGYWNRAEETEQKIAEGEPGGAGLLRTGDLGRRKHDGSIEILGRADHQVKIRGVRIELGEITTILEKLDGVDEAFAHVEGREDDARIVAYVGSSSTTGELIPAIRAHARAHLHPTMQPSAYAVVRELPRRLNGKVDTGRLPEAVAPSLDEQSPSVRPRTRLEKQVAGIWRRTLRRDRVGIRDDFFDLGGDSLSALKILAELEQTMGRTVPLATFFRQPTVEGIVRELECRTSSQPIDLLVTIREGEKTPVFCLPGIGGHLFAYQALANALPEDHACHGLHPPGLDGSVEPCRTVESLAAVLVKEIVTKQPTGPYCLVGYSFGGLVAYEIARQLEASGRTVGFLALLESRAPGWIRRRRFASALRRALGRAARSKWLGGLFRRLIPDDSSGSWEYQLPPEESSGELTAIIQNVYEASLNAQRAYRPGPLNSPVVLLRAAELPEWQSQLVVDDQLGWGEFVTGPLHTRVVPGNHMEFLHRETVPYIAHVLREYLGGLGVSSSSSVSVRS